VRATQAVLIVAPVLKAY